MKRNSKLKPQPNAPLEEKVFVSLLRTADALSRGGEALLQKPYSLSGTQYNILHAHSAGCGRAEPGLPRSRLRLISRDPDITRLLDRMESGDGLRARGSRTAAW